MNKLNIIALLAIFSLSCLNSSAQFDSKVFDKQVKLTEARNRRKPQGVSRGFKKLKSTIFNRPYREIFLPLQSITLHLIDIY